MSPATGQITKLEKGEPLPERAIGLYVGKVLKVVDVETGADVYVRVLSFGKGALVVKPLKTRPAAG
jgi:hypothetical protein